MKNDDQTFSDRFLSKLMNTDPDFGRGECRITIEVGRGLLVEGCRGISEYSEDKIALLTCSRSVVIEGSRLCICRMMGRAMVICGSISSVSFT